MSLFSDEAFKPMSQRWLNFVLVLSLSALSSTAFAGESKGTGSAGGGASDKPSGCTAQTKKPNLDPPSLDVQDEEAKVLGTDATCMDDLFQKETSDNPSCYQPVTQDSPGVGLCTINGRRDLRKSHGPDCDVPDDELFSQDGKTSQKQVDQQMKCCDYMANNSPGYFAKPNKLPCSQGKK